MLFALMLLLFNPESALAAFRGLKQFGRPGDVVLKTTLPDFVQASQASSDDASKRFEGMMSSFIDPTAYRAARSSVDGLRASTAESYKQQSAFPFPSFSPSPSSTQQQANPYATKQPAAQNPEPSPTSTNNGRLDSTEKEDDPPPAASNKEVVPSISKETTPAKQPAVNDGSLKNVALNMHNHLRARHQASPLEWSSALASDAAGWANGCKWGHSDVEGQGENLAIGYKDAATAIRVWVDEERRYKYGEVTPNMDSFEEIGHFTQMVWRSTTSVGCAISKCQWRGRSAAEYLVCRYSPAGNVLGQFVDNVKPPK